VSDSWMHCVPIDQALVEWLCDEVGCSLLSAIGRPPLCSISNEDLKKNPWLLEMLKRSKSGWRVADAVGRGAPADELDALLEETAADVHSIRDPQGRTMEELATVKGHASSLDWLVRVKGADLERKDAAGNTVCELAVQLGLTDMVRQIGLLREWSEGRKRAEVCEVDVPLDCVGPCTLRPQKRKRSTIQEPTADLQQP
jgi:hypothetical protein